jgi:hypothetical protein
MAERRQCVVGYGGTPPKAKVPSKSRQPFICHKHISGNECSETTL